MRLLSVVMVLLVFSLAAWGQQQPTTRPVVVELFTSEGCSSCPPADALLTELTARSPLPDVQIIPLAYHVDYWNDLGWADPFSSPVYSARQRAYTAALGTQTFTPQAVVNGQVSVVGSRRSELLRAFRDAPPLPLSVTLAVTRDPATAAVTLAATLPASEDRATATLVVTEDALVTDVPAGENAGRRLPHSATVRALRPFAVCSPAAVTSVSTPVILAPAWDPARLHLTVLLEHPQSHRILGAATTPVRPR